MGKILRLWSILIVLLLASILPTWAAPTVVSLTTPVLPANAARTSINSLTTSAGTPIRYRILTLPTGGTLYVNGAAVTAARNLTLAEATQLSFLPSGTAGNHIFTFNASDGNGSKATSAAATYTISVGQASCGQGDGFDFSTLPLNDPWKSRTNVAAGTVTISTSDYSTSAGTDRFQVADDQAGDLSQGLSWFTDYAASSSSESKVTFTFSRPLLGFTIVVQDIDAASATASTNPSFIDQVQFDGYTSDAATTPIALTVANIRLGNTSAFSGNNRVTGTNASSADPAGNVIVTFPQAITKLTLTYRNTQTTLSDPAQQAIAIPSIGWCAQADVATTLTGPNRASAGNEVPYTMTTTNNGPDVITTLNPTLQLPVGLTITGASNGGTINTSTGLVTFPAISNLAVGATVTNTLNFTMPNTGSVTGTGAYTSSILDVTAGNNTYTLSTAQNRAPVANNVTNSPAILSSKTSQTSLAPLNANDPDATSGNTTIVSYTIVSLPSAAEGILYVDGVAATVNQVILVPTSATPTAPGYQLSFVPNGTFGGTASFTYRATDDTNTSSNIATYTIPVTVGADLVSTVNGIPSTVEGQFRNFSVTTTNNGPATATEVVPTLRLSSMPPFSSVSLTNGSYDPTTGTITFTSIPSLASGSTVVSSATLVMQATPSSFTVTAANTSATADPIPANNNGTAAASILAVTVSKIGPAGTASACATPGRDGSPTITTNPNTYYPAANQTVAVNATSFTVSQATGSILTPIAKGDLLLIIQMQGADIDASNTDSYGDGVAGGFATNNLSNTNFIAGQYEYAVADGPVPVGGGTVILATGLKNSYQNADATATTGQRRFQVVRIPQYANLTVGGIITPSAWDGSSGGILALDVTGKISFAAGARLDATGKGFRGGAGQQLAGTTGLTGTDYRATAPTSATTTAGAHAMKGEGTVGTPRYVNTGSAVLDTGVDGYPNGSAGRGGVGNAGGGGTDSNPTENSENSGGGGGANGARGGRGGNAWSSNAAVGGEFGSAFNSPSSSRLIMGGGGGAGVTNDGTGGGPSLGYASSGAAGGGIVLVRTGSVAGLGSVLASGASASGSVLNDGSGGGGAGGSILITANSTSTLEILNLAANGGNGGSNTGAGQAHGPGGGGGGGIILTNGATASAAVAPGVNGTTAGSSAFGATAGLPGLANNQISNSIANSTAGINCSADATAAISGTASAVAGQTVSLSAVFANNGGINASDITRTVTLVSGSAQNPVTGVSAPGSLGISDPDPATGNVTITYPGLSALNAGASNSFALSYTAPGTTSVSTTAAIITETAELITNNNTSATTTAITGFADVVSGVFGITSSTTGRPTGVYSAAFANNGPAAAANITRTVTLPAGATLTTAQLNNITAQGGTYNSSTQVIDFGNLLTLNSRDAKIFNFSYIAPNIGGSTSIVSRITTTTPEDANGGTGAATAPNTFPFDVTNNTSADVAVNGISSSATSVVPNQQASFTINYINYGPGEAVNALRYAQLTPGLSIVSITGGGTYDATTGIVTYPVINSVPNGGTTPSTITFLAPATGLVTISGSYSTGAGSISSGIFDNNQATASIAVTPIADVATTISGPASAVAGNLLTLVVTTANSGPSRAAAVAQSVQLPLGLSGVFASNGGVYDANNGAVTFPVLDVLASGSILSNTVSFNMPSAGFAATSAVSTTTGEASGTTANNTATTATINSGPATTALANMYSTLTLSDKSVTAGAPLTFTITTGNNGPVSALNVVQRLFLPPGLSVSSISGGGTYNSATSLVTFPAIASQTSGTSVTNTIELTAPAASTIVAAASVSSTTSDPVPADNLVIRHVDVIPTADLATTIVGAGVASATQVTMFAVNTINNGPSPAVNVVQTVSIPANFDPSEVTTSAGGIYDPATGVITWPAVASLAVGENRAYTYSYVAPSFKSTDVNNPRVVVSQASVISSTLDGVGVNNTAFLATEIKWNADVAVAVAGPTAAIAGNPVTFIVSVINHGPAPASNITPTARIATGLPNLVASGGGVYDITTGIVTFPTITNQAVGVTGAITYAIRLTVPDRPIIGVSAAANLPATTNDINLTDNAATLIIPVMPATNTQVDLQTTITADRTSQQAGQPIVLTITATNAGPMASDLRQQVSLPAALTGVVVTDSNGSILAGAYDAPSGMVTFPQVSNQAANATLTYRITVNNPGNDPLVARANINGNFLDPTPANNTQSVSVNIIPVADVATRIGGPATMLPGGLATYQVITLNNGPSPANAVTQTVQLPTGLSGVLVSGGGSYDAASGRVSFPTIATQAVSKAGEVTNTISFAFPTTASTIVGTVVSGTTENESTRGNNTSTLTTTLTNQAVVAYSFANRLQSPQGNTADPLSISALNGLDPDGSLASFTITSLPAAAAGVLLLNGSAIAAGQAISLADAANLKFDPAASFVGNAFFTYTTTDNQNATSASARYVIAVGLDKASLYTTTPTKGGDTPYQDGDILANVFDVNGGVYNTASAITDNGVRDSRVSSGDLPPGVALDPITGQMRVADRMLLRPGTYSVGITTTDTNGGITSQVVSVPIGDRPLPVELVNFEAKASGQDGQLKWATAQEKDNAGFQVERSFNGTDFEPVGFVTGAGNSTQSHSYAFVDAGVGRQYAGHVYYRLQQRDNSGTTSYSPVRTVTFVQKLVAKVSLYPNPAVTQTTLDLTSLPATAYQVVIVDMAGRQVRSQTLAGGTAHRLMIDTLPNGSYLLIISNSSQRITQRLLKQ